jgi:hypothetical protein
MTHAKGVEDRATVYEAEMEAVASVEEELTPKQTKAALKFHIAEIDLQIANLQHQKQQAKLQLAAMK